MVYLHNAILLGCKKGRKSYLFDTVDGPGEYYAICQSEEDKYRIISIMCGI